MSSASTYDRDGERAAPAEGWTRYYRRHQGPLCPWGEISGIFLVPTMADRHKNRTRESEAARKRESRAAKGES